MGYLRSLCGVSVCVVAVATCTDLRAQGQPDASRPPVTPRVTQPKKQQPPQRPAGAATPAESAGQAPVPSGTPTPPEGPQRTETIVYDAWTVTCRDTVGAKTKKACSATLQVIDQEHRQVVFVWIIGRTAEGKLMTLLQTPTGVQIQPGVELKVENGAVRKLNYVACEPGRCEASTAMDDSMVKEIVAGTKATATIYATDGRGINFNMQIAGASKAIPALQ